jgi:hypothetical protein
LKHISWRSAAGIAGLIVLAALLVVGCSHIYRKNYFLTDESPAVISYQGYHIQLEMQSRLAGYSGSENLFYLSFQVSHPEPDTGIGQVSPLNYFELDSVCVQPYNKDTLICLNKIDEYEILDNYYNREDYLTRYQYDGLELSNSNPFIWVSYTVRVLDPRTGAVTADKRFEQELKRFAYRTY